MFTSAFFMKDYKIPSDLLILNGIDAMFEAQAAARTLLNKESDAMLSEVSTTKIDNITREVDQVAEYTAKKCLYDSFGRLGPYRDSLVVWGEESITQNRDLHFNKEHRTVALLDMIDGTDLLHRQLGNWCSAMVFFYPPDKQILGALVGFPSRIVYGATPSRRAFKMPLCSKGRFTQSVQHSVDLVVQDNGNALDEAGICFYGQKARNLLSLFGSRFPESLGVGGLSAEYMLTHFARNKPPFRIYNLGGNPMMAKLTDGAVQAVFELLGQKPHDVVPGAYIAKMAGAIVKDLNRNDLRLEEALLRPNEGEMRYIIASSARLYEELLGYLRSQSAS
jgi:fructose-1,6-bisphosphatase/inositol monophosphatase family enzyme